MAENEELNKAVTWFTQNAPTDADGNPECPWCEYSTIETEEGRQRSALGAHARAQHPEKAVAAYLNPDKGFDAFAIIMREKAEADEAQTYIDDNLEVIDERDEFDMIAIPEEFKRKERLEGGQYRLAAPDRLNRYLTMGAQTVERPKTWHPNVPQSTEDTSLKINELTLVYFPPELYKRRMRVKQKAAADLIGNLTNRQEERSNRVGDIGKIVYDHYIKGGMPHENAMVIARNAEKRSDASPQPDPSNETVFSKG